ncbi:MAG: NAD(P)/FAD-dependent oxidoreductase [Thermomicrobiales bacterium]
MTGRDAEVVVVGGGPAGSMTAMLLAQRGHQVLLLDKSTFPRHKACSEYINAGGVRVLREVGLLDDVRKAGAHVVDGMIVHAPGGNRYFADVAHAAPGRHGLGLSRYRLDQILLDGARRSGVDVCENAWVRSVDLDPAAGVRLEVSEGRQRRQIRCSFVVGADGAHSVVSRSLGLDRHVRWPRRTGLVAHYRGVAGLERSGEMHVTEGGYAGLAPLEDGLSNVAVVVDSDRVRGRPDSVSDFFDSILASLPNVAGKLEGSERVGTVRGVGPMSRRVGRTAGARFALVGDAAGFLDPFTGDGIYEGLRAAQLAAPVISQALNRHDFTDAAMGDYRRARQRVFTGKRQVCWIVQGFIHQPALMDYVTVRLNERESVGDILTAVLANVSPARKALSPLFLARLLRP